MTGNSIEDISYKDGVIKVRRSGHWKAVVYMPRATTCEPSYPMGEDRDEVIAEAKRMIDAKLAMTP
jgi:hypothetical protein